MPVEPRVDVVAKVVDDPDAEGEAHRTGIDWSWVRELFSRLLRMRRSTALIALSAVVVVVLAMTALTLVQRVQVDPLQTGAEQVERLSFDSSNETPEMLKDWPGELEAFEDYYGLRMFAAFNAENWFLASGSGDCLTVFAEEAVTFGPNSISGPMMSSCGAGSFPAMVQFAIESETAPADLRAAFPDSTAFQFVLDAENREIVVFMSR